MVVDVKRSTVCNHFAVISLCHRKFCIQILKQHRDKGYSLSKKLSRCLY